MLQPTRHQQIAELLLDLEAVMRNLGLWSQSRPELRALASREPFCVDTLSFDEWLQFVFIERMQVMVEEEQALPCKSEIVPMAEEAFRNRRYPKSLIDVLQSIDNVLTV